MLESFEPEEDPLESKAMQLLNRYGVVFPELMARERMAPRWRDLVRVYRRLELKGEIRGGRFVSGFVGEQFALPDAVAALRDAHRAAPTGALEVVAACDPLNLVGIVTPGERVPAQPGNRIVFRDGVAGGVAGERRCRQPLQCGRRHDGCRGKSSIRPRPTVAEATTFQPYDAYQDSSKQDWRIPEQAMMEPVPAISFNLN